MSRPPKQQPRLSPAKPADDNLDSLCPLWRSREARYGSPWFLIGTPDQGWNNDDLRTLRQLHGNDFEALDGSSLMIDPDSGAID